MPDYGPISPSGVYVRHYGCCKCQRRHYEDQEIFEEHLWAQSKHGVEEMTMEARMNIAANFEREIEQP